MKPLLVLGKTSVLPWHGHTKRCMGVLILVVDQGVDPLMGVFPNNNNVIHRIEIQIFYSNCTWERTCPILRWKVTPQILLKDVASVQPHNFFPPHKMFKFILILGPALEAHYIALSSLVTSSMYMFMMSYCIVWPDV